ncbi:hypothetical protein OS188_06195 [Xanthomarina sp. F1114]|uniref:hypothetical protein n=1 Tax=Xanthomarina sp. F1114 TaxID=2996019 RepID=UPI00225DF7C9|nr:hypothetical protein [Xanthomarina sp. F1114]MCX7547542.1 hypothetical protein [Xanthomarina sp. F1114]
MRLTDKQSLLICAIVAFGFSVLGILGALENYVVVGILLFLFILVVYNLVSSKHLFDKDEEPLEKEDTILHQDKTL